MLQRSLPFLVTAVLITACGASGGEEAVPSPAGPPTLQEPPPLESTARPVESVDTVASTSLVMPVGCKDPNARCLGVLQPGDYQSTNIDLFGTGRPGQLSYTVPQGWANTLDHQPAYWLRPAVDYAADDSYDGNETTSGIYVWGDVAAARQGSSCAEWSDETVDTDPTSLSAWMAGLPGLVVTPPTAGTIDGKSLVEFDIMLDAEVAPLCPWGRFVPLLAGRPGAEDSYMWGIGAGEQMRMRIIDLGDGHTASVIIDGPAEVFDELLQMSEPVIDSLRFSPGT